MTKVERREMFAFASTLATEAEEIADEVGDTCDRETYALIRSVGRLSRAIRCLSTALLDDETREETTAEFYASFGDDREAE